MAGGGGGVLPGISPRASREQGVQSCAHLPPAEGATLPTNRGRPRERSWGGQVGEHQPAGPQSRGRSWAANPRALPALVATGQLGSGEGPTATAGVQGSGLRCPPGPWERWISRSPDSGGWSSEGGGEGLTASLRTGGLGPPRGSSGACSGLVTLLGVLASSEPLGLGPGACSVPGTVVGTGEAPGNEADRNPAPRKLNLCRGKGALTHATTAWGRSGHTPVTPDGPCQSWADRLWGRG